MLAAALSRLLIRSSGTEIAVSAVTPLSGGASSATFAVDASRDGASWPLIFQRAEGAGHDSGGGAMTKATQAALQRIAGAHGVPVAAVVAVAEQPEPTKQQPDPAQEHQRRDDRHFRYPCASNHASASLIAASYGRAA